LVQNRWGHLNQYQNILTELQTLQLNTHFTVEQRGRYEAGYPCQFNGTAGIWKKEAIIDGGNWEADTLTEDLDLSYRVQLKGWKIIFLDDHVAPAELPSSVNALKSQQFRWMKGGAETAKKLIPQIFLSNWNFINKLQSFFHLLGSSVYLLIFLMGLTSVPLLILGKAKTNLFLFENWFYLISFYFIFIIYFYSNVFLAWSEKSLIYKAIKFALLFPIFLSLSMGLALHNTVAVIQGWVGKKSSFVRTPKTGQNNSINYDVYKLGWITIGEGLLFLYYFAAMIFSLATKDHRFLYFHFLTSFGFGTIFILTLIGLKKHKHAN
jgi:cellulose synthase/poly-beta-1,6-N-acetylglucosamine synthase-like glycosyltransferase